MILGVAGAILPPTSFPVVVFFGANAPEGTPVWVYSALYNLGYLVPSLIATIVAALFVLPVLNAAVPVRPRSAGQASS